MTESRKSASPLFYLAALGVAFLVLCYFVAIPAFQDTFRHQTLSGIRNISVPEAKALIEAGALVVDVRERAVSEAAHLPGAHLIPIRALAAQLPSLEAYKGAPIIVYDGDGGASGPRAALLLQSAGFVLVYNLNSGFRGWRAAGLDARGA